MIYVIFTLWFLNINVYHNYFACVCICLVAQSCPTLATPCTAALQLLCPWGIFQARILEWVAVPSSRGSSQPRDRTQVSHIAGGFFTI